MPKTKKPQGPVEQYPAGKYLVTGPEYGCVNKYVGEFKPGRESREIDLSKRAVRDLQRSPFTLKLLPAPKPPAPPE